MEMRNDLGGRRDIIKYSFILAFVILLLGYGYVKCQKYSYKKKIINILTKYPFFEGLEENFTNALSDLINENIKSIKDNQRNEILEFQFNISKNYFDILVLGKTGSGKSTLINSLLQLDKKEGAKIGDSEPTTKKFTSYTSKTLPGIRMWDSEGLSLNNNINSALNKINNFIKSKEHTDNLDSFIDIIIYCINSDNSRFEDEEADLIKNLRIDNNNTTLPVLILFSRSVVDENYHNIKQAVIEKCNIKNMDDILRVQAIEINQIIHGERKILMRAGLYELILSILKKLRYSTDSLNQKTLGKRIINQYIQKLLHKNKETELLIKNNKYNFHNLIESLLKEYEFGTSKEKMEDFEKEIEKIYIERINNVIKGEKENEVIKDINSDIIFEFINTNNKIDFTKRFQNIINEQLLKILNKMLYGGRERIINKHLKRVLTNAIDNIKFYADKVKTKDELDFYSF
jgi:predicted GTPase